VVPVDLTELVRSAAEAWAPRCAPDGPRLLTELPTVAVLVETDPGRIRQVVDGLCENALRIVPAGAPLILAVRAGERGAIVEVRDGGPGFTDDDLAVAFERGALHQRYAGIRKVGSGLGLALAARLVTRLGGTIEAGHAAEGGARFTVGIPYPIRTRH
jgi:two-component system sensor histidine kinase BaeS